VLLKATHIPFVAAIWAYEHFVTSGRSSGAGTISGPETPAAKRPPQLSIVPPRPFAAGFQTSTGGNGRTTNRPQTRGGPSDTDPQLKSLVLKLTSQVDQLTAMVSQLQEQREVGTAA